MSADSPVIVWFRQDLRLADNPALSAAAALGRPVIPVFILDDIAPGVWKPGGATRWWLHHSLTALAESLAALGSPLVLRRGPADAVLYDLVAETGATHIVWNRCYEPFARERDSTVKATLRTRGVTTESFNGSLLNEPWTVLTGDGRPYRVFTPYWRAVLRGPAPGAPLPVPARLLAPGTTPVSDAPGEWALLPTAPDWAGGLRGMWQPGEAGAKARMVAFLESALTGYAQGRDRPAIDGTSRLSPHLHFGEISPRQAWHMAKRAQAGCPGADHGADGFLREIGWREFSYNLLFHFPTLPHRPLNPRFEEFPWTDDAKALSAWKRGRTGYPIVDAGMRQLWHTGWMHNRVRMIVGSLLVKHLLLPWQAGQAWFWDTLVDADLANNAAGWQWIAGCGADAAPYFRVFNPTLQGKKFDPDGAYVRRWVPELRNLPDAYIHSPWEAPELVLRGAGVTLGREYPRPIVEHTAGRDRALAAFARIKGAAQETGAQEAGED